MVTCPPQAQAVTLTVAQAFKVALDMWEIAQEGEVLCHVWLFRLYMAHIHTDIPVLIFPLQTKARKFTHATPVQTLNLSLNLNRTVFQVHLLV